MQQWRDFDPKKYLDSTTYNNLQSVRQYIQHDFDYVLVIAQKTIGNRYGKSQLGLLACKTIAPDKFNEKYIFFSDNDYWKMKLKLEKNDALDFDEGIYVFWSRDAARHEQKELFKEFLTNPSHNFFTVICIPNINLIQKDFKNLKINCLWVIDRRGRFYSYSQKTGSLQRIKFLPSTKEVEYPEPDFVGHWRDVAKDKIWERYLQLKDGQLAKKMVNVNVIKRMEKMEKKMDNSYTLRDMAKIAKINESTISKWRDRGLIPKSYMFNDPSGRIRITKSGFEKLLKRVERWRMKRKERSRLKLKKMKKVHKKSKKKMKKIR
jgi:hypothetical protein